MSITFLFSESLDAPNGHMPKTQRYSKPNPAPHGASVHRGSLATATLSSDLDCGIPVIDGGLDWFRDGGTAPAVR
jgi:hypothetical protein